MVVISSAELRNNMKKYPEKHLTPDEDFYRAISAEELLEGIKEDIHEMFRKKKNENNEKSIK